MFHIEVWKLKIWLGSPLRVQGLISPRTVSGKISDVGVTREIKYQYNPVLFIFLEVTQSINYHSWGFFSGCTLTVPIVKNYTMASILRPSKKYQNCMISLWGIIKVTWLWVWFYIKILISIMPHLQVYQSFIKIVSFSYEFPSFKKMWLGKKY